MTKMRPIKPGFIQDYDLCAAERETGLPLRLAFAALLAVADREGRFRWRPSELKVGCLPYDDADFSLVLGALAARELLVEYECGGEHYGHIPTWRDHRVINPMERPSDLPAPREGAPVSHAPAAREPRVDDARGPAISAPAAADDTAAPLATIEPEAPDPSPSPAPLASPSGAREDPAPPEPSAALVDEPPETSPAEPEAAPAPEAGPPLNGGGDGLAAEPEPAPEGADGLAVADVLHEGVDRGDHGGNGRGPEALDGAADAVPVTQAVADENWTWQMDRELYDVMVAAAIQQGASPAEAEATVTAHFGGNVPAPLHDPAAGAPADTIPPSA